MEKCIQIMHIDTNKKVTTKRKDKRKKKNDETKEWVIVRFLQETDVIQMMVDKYTDIYPSLMVVDLHLN